jgi:hypothetical protein
MDPDGGVVVGGVVNVVVDGVVEVVDVESPAVD